VSVVEFVEKGGAVSFKVRVSPRASRTEVAGEHGGAIKLRVAAPPADGKANEECRRFLARLLGVGPSSVEIVSGDSSRDKLVRVRDSSVGRVREALKA
jgi:uncharacterized protein (TIGR00251 family)